MATETKPVKILTVGSAVGSIKELFGKVKAIDAKHGKFDFVLCLGDFFGPIGEQSEGTEDQVAMLLEGKLEAPIECYIMQGENPVPDSVIQKFAKTGGELCKNVFLMSKSGLVTTANGLRVACLGGTYNEDVYSSADAAPGFASPFFSAQSIERLLSNTLATTSSSKQDYKSLASIQSSSSSSQLVDIFISNTWPDSVSQFSTVPIPNTEGGLSGAVPLDDVVRRIKPKYYFAACGGKPPVFWEREPYVWEDEPGGRISRFVSLGAFGGEQPASGKKQRWFYAFSITPNAPPAPRPANATRNPFTEGVTRPAKRSFDDAGGENYIFGNVQHPGKRVRQDQPQNGKPPPGYKCRRCESTEHFINDCPERSKPPEGYVCRICNTPGHLVRDCPTRHAVGDTGGRKPKEGYVCRACGSEAHYLDDCPVANQRPAHPGGEGRGRGRRGPPKEIEPSECWFCLANPNLAKHLIVSIGTECYVTLPKGQIIPTQSSAEHVDVPGGGHVLIVPISHFPTYTTIPSDLAPPIVDETERYKSALRGFYAKNFCVPVFFEVGRISGKGGHAHVQAVPVPNKLKDKVEDAFITEGRSQGIDFEEDADGALEACQGGRGGYFRVDLPDGRKMVHLIKEHVPFGIQFGRQVLVNLLGMPERLDWKACTLSEDEDRADAAALKTAFAPFDPTG
ncbi:hypothetical protein V5O48_013917 [Marasmius crinis-equi]|uniref:CCHC-type domain-containing protein n=1 Tax=Marasmius crinis-equi TaxID=585013 RepID=A0ABR3EYR4_9AGAR